tara:strand:+ start:2891 stop:2992 length:102 start_codon:yes stop_codon:yes gene_type:complete
MRGHVIKVTLLIKDFLLSLLNFNFLEIKEGNIK